MLKRCKKSFSGICFFLLSGLAVSAWGSDFADSRPNIIFLLTDDQAFSALGCYGNQEIMTPHIDKMASQGVRFLNHYNTTAICTASRANILTGLYEYRTGCNFDHGPMQR